MSVQPASRWIVVALALAVAPASGAGAQPGTPAPAFQGRVIDAYSMAPIKGARVAVGDRAVATDAAGRFALALPPGAWTVEVSAAGYLTDTEPIAIGDTPLVLEILLVNRSQFREQVTVTGGAGDATGAPATVPISPLEVRSIAGAAENVFRALHTLPGVAATEDFGSRLSVRGGGPDQNLTVMDGIEIYNPFRLFGLTSAFNPETVENFELTAGGFGPKYGDRLSSLLLVENRAGRRDHRAAGSFSLGLTDSNVILEGQLPAGANGSWLITGRRTYYDLVAERFIDEDLPSFADVQAKTVWEPRSGSRLTLFGLRSRETADAELDGGGAGERLGFISTVRNDVAAASFSTPLGSRIASRTVASWYRNTDVLSVDGDVRNEARRSNSAIAEYPLVDLAFTRGLSVRDVAVRQELAARVSARHFLDAGFDVHRLRTNVRWTITGDRNIAEANGTSVQGGISLPSSLDSTRRTTRAAAWIVDRIDARRATLEPGVRVDWSGVNAETTVSPRFTIVWPLNEFRVRASGGLFTQSPGYEKLVQADYFVDLTDAGRLNLHSERAVHAIGGIERDIAAGVVARVEGFYKGYSRLIVGRLETPAETAARVALYDVPAAAASSVPAARRITDQPINGATGRSYGFDVFVSRRATSAATRLTGWASYTFGRADIAAYGRRYPFDYDRRHALSLVGTYRIRRSLDVAATLRVASGFPTTLPVGVRVAGVADAADADRDGNTTEIVPMREPDGAFIYEVDPGGVGRLNGDRLPVFARLDGRVTWRKTRWQFYVEVMNVLNRDNAGDLVPNLQHDPASDRPQIQLSREGGIPRLPSLGIRFRF